MPAIALVGAAASVTAGLGAITAAGGLAAMSIGSALAAGAMVAGGVLTGLGTITGNKKLTKIGAVLGLAGGIGNMFAGGANAASSGLGQAVDATGGLETATSFGTNELAGSLTGSGPLDFSGAFTSPVASPSGIVGSQLGAPLPNGVSPGDFADTLGGPQAAASAPSMVPGAAETAATQQQVAAVSGQTGIQAPSLAGKTVGAAPNTLGEAASRLKGFGSDAMKYISDPKNANVVKLGGGLVQGAMKSYSDQSMYDQKMAAQEAERARFNRSIIGQYTTR